MAGQFSNLRDDDCFIVSRVKQSTQPFNYAMYAGQWKNCQPCFPVYGAVPDGQWFDSKNPDLVDIESVLKNQSYPRVGCGRDNVRLLDVNEINPDVGPNCGKWITPMDTLMTHPKQYYKELQVDRFYDLERPQESGVFWDYAVNERLAGKDAHVERYPVPLSMNPSLPTAQRSPDLNHVRRSRSNMQYTI